MNWNRRIRIEEIQFWGIGIGGIEIGIGGIGIGGIEVWGTGIGGIRN